MASLKIVPSEHWSIIKQYVKDSNAVIFVPEEHLKELPEEQAQLLRDADGEPIDYNFGGEADVWVDIFVPGQYCADEIIDLLKQRTET